MCPGQISDPLFLSVQSGASAVWLEAITPGAAEGVRSEGERKAHQAQGDPQWGAHQAGVCVASQSPTSSSAHSSSLLLPPMEFGP